MMRLRLLTAIFCIVPGTLLADLKVPRDIAETMQWMADALSQSGHISAVRTDIADMALEVELADGETAKIYPHNLHDKLKQLDSAAERQQEFDFHIRTTLEDVVLAARDEAEYDLESIYPILRHKSYKTSTQTDEPGQAVFTSRGIGDSDILYAFDSENSIAIVQQADIENLGISAEELDELAQRNLERKYPALTIEGDSLYLLELDGFYESSFVTYAPLWRDVDRQLNEVIMIVPNRDVVVFADGAYDGAEAALRAVLADFSANSPYPVSEFLYRWENEIWVSIP